MYLYHFGIRQLPFTLTPNTQFYFGLPSHNEAINVLTTALESGEGFIKVTGEVGTGKTLICRKLLNELSDGFVTAYIPNPYLSPAELRKSVAAELQVDLSTNGDQQEFTHKIQQRLIEIRQQHKAVLLIIDEAQALPDESIEALRLMTNLETESCKLMQVVLFGQPELNDKISKPELRQLKQRITFSYSLKQMDADQIFQYSRHRMRVAGHATGDVFSKGVCRLLFKVSNGTPRLVNIIAHKALMLAYGEGKYKISRKHIKLAAKDTEAAFAIPGFPWMAWALPVVVLGVTGLTLFTTNELYMSYQELLSYVSRW
ncbi:ExeA family protein [Glaciecola sp. 1036]|uniref:ExeA family protein n=1 Tax=Alteromonadaceae TaxID=72275 RepID=UPI003CFCE0EA